MMTPSWGLPAVDARLNAVADCTIHELGAAGGWSGRSNRMDAATATPARAIMTNALLYFTYFSLRNRLPSIGISAEFHTK
jgi:hypothetical protein